MEQMPQPIDVNKLKNILGNAKKIMQVTESGNYKTGNIDSNWFKIQALMLMKVIWVELISQKLTINHMVTQQDLLTIIIKR